MAQRAMGNELPLTSDRRLTVRAGERHLGRQLRRRAGALALAGLTLFLVACGDAAPATSVSLGEPPAATVAATSTTAPVATAMATATASQDPTTSSQSGLATPAIAAVVPTATPTVAMATATAPAATPAIDAAPVTPGTSSPAPVSVVAAMPTPTATAVAAQPSATAQPTATATTAAAQPDPTYYAQYLQTRGWTAIGKPLTAEVTGNGAVATLYVSYGQDCGSCHMQQITVFVGRTVIYEHDRFAEPKLTALPDHRGFVIEEHFPGATESWTASTGWRRHTLTWQGTAFAETDRQEYVPPAATATRQPTPTSTAALRVCCHLVYSVLLPDGTPAKGLTINAVAEVIDQQGKVTGTKQCPLAGCTSTAPQVEFVLPAGWQGRITITVAGYQTATYTVTMPNSDRTVALTLVPAR